MNVSEGQRLPYPDAVFTEPFEFTPEVQSEFEEYLERKPSLKLEKNKVLYSKPEAGFAIESSRGLIIERTYFGFRYEQGSLRFFPTSRLEIAQLSGLPAHVNSISRMLGVAPTDEQLPLAIRFCCTWPNSDPTKDGRCNFSYLYGQEPYGNLSVHVDYEFDCQPARADHFTREPESGSSDLIRKRIFTRNSVDIKNEKRGYKLRVNDNYWTYIFMLGGKFGTRLVLPSNIGEKAIFSKLVSSDLLENPLTSEVQYDTWRDSNLFEATGIKLEAINIPYSRYDSFDLKRLEEMIEREDAEIESWEEK